MYTILNLATDERSARIVLATLTEHRDTTTGSLVRRVGGMEALRLLDADTSAPGLDEATTGVGEHSSTRTPTRQRCGPLWRVPNVSRC